MIVKKKTERANKLKIDFDAKLKTRSDQLQKSEISKLSSEEGPYPDLFIEAKNGFSVQKVKSLFFSKTKHIFIGSGCNIKIFSATSGSWIQTLRGHNDEVTNICCWKMGKKEVIVTCDKSGKVIFWNEGSKKQEVYLPEGEKVGYFEVMQNGYLVGHTTPQGGLQNIHHLKSFESNNNPQCLFQRVEVGPNKVSVNRERSLVAAFRNKELFYSYSPFRDMGKHKLQHPATCVQCHPCQDMVAVGDVLGQITLFYEVNKKKTATQILHWHTLPVGDFCFSYTGSQLISGGGECVCIMWDIGGGIKHKLPRLGMPIVGVTLDEENDYIIITHSDNGISLINAHSFMLEGVIAGLTKHIPEVEGWYEMILPAGLNIHPGTKQLVLNGRVGHLQFYDVHKDQLICHLDITQTNYLSDERHTSLANPDVTHVDISSDGSWMVTCESCTLSPSFTDVKMKFWLFDQENQCWKLNTRIIQPHTGAITNICFCPVSPNTPLRCISCGTDGKFNVWVLYNADKIETKESNEHWYCFLSEQHLNLIPSCCTFSPDASMFAVAFGPVLTLWETSNLKFLGTLSQPFLKNDIRFVQFNEGSHAGCFLISCSPNWVCCWDILSSKLLWRIQHTVSAITSNPISGMMAIFTEDKEAFLFHPSRCKPVSTLSDFSPNIMIGAKFVPSMDRAKSTSDTPWLSNHSLVCIDSEQVLYTVNGKLTEVVSERGVDTLNPLTGDTQWSTGMTPFSALVSKSREKVEIKQKEDNRNAEMAFTSPDTLIKAFADIRISHINSFSSILKEFSGVVPSVPVSTSPTSAPTYVTLDEEIDGVQMDETDGIEVTNYSIKLIKFGPIASSINWKT